MKKQTIYLVIIGLLLLLNLWQLIAPIRHLNINNRNGFDNNVAKILQLNKEQKQQFSRFVKEHRQQIHRLQQQQKEKVARYFKHPNDTLLNTLSTIEIKRIKVTQQHFSDIKSILKPEQLADFKIFKSKALNRILHKKPKHFKR